MFMVKWNLYANNTCDIIDIGIEAQQMERFDGTVNVNFYMDIETTGLFPSYSNFVVQTIQ